MDIPDSVIRAIRFRALIDVCDGLNTPRRRYYIQECTHFHGATGTQIIYTRDVGHHASGWFKNPEYERCLHLSLSFCEPQGWSPERLSNPRLLADLGIIVPQARYNRTMGATWAELLFGVNAARMAWIESPVTQLGKTLEVMHYRVFCDPAWQPIHPRKEVYSREFTEAGWKSWSDMHGLDVPEPSTLHAG